MPPASLPHRLRAPAWWAAGVAAATLVLHLRDPHDPGSYAFCPWLLLTGTYCPGCGGLRAVHDLSHGDVAEAASTNLLVVAFVPMAVALWGAWTWSRWRRRPLVLAPAAQLALWSLVLVAPGFAVLRNLGPAAWLAP